jgi:protocatechuate 3,4-dioxygenase beta subunit
VADDETNQGEGRITRRASLVKAVGLVATAIGGASGMLRTEGAQASAGGPAAVASGAVKCVLTPELTEGPFYIRNERIRRNITEGQAGTSLALHATVVSASNCSPIKGALLDVWQANADGNYSDFGDDLQSPPFLRGSQPTDASGLAIFETIYPGWYTGRAVHIHVKVHIGGNVVHTGQLFFPDSLTKSVFKAVPYAYRGPPDTLNASDPIYVNGGSKGMLSLTKAGAGYLGRITMGVHTA